VHPVTGWQREKEVFKGSKTTGGTGVKNKGGPKEKKVALCFFGCDNSNKWNKGNTKRGGKKGGRKKRKRLRFRPRSQSGKHGEG